MLLKNIGDFFKNVGSDVVNFVKGLDVKEASVLGVAVGAAIFTVYILGKHLKNKIKHAFNKKAKTRTVVENILDSDVECDDEDIDIMHMNPAVVGFKNGYNAEHSAVKVSATKKKNIFETIESMINGKNKKNHKKKKRKYTDAELADYYRDQIHRLNDSPEEYQRWRERIDSYKKGKKNKKFEFSMERDGVGRRHQYVLDPNANVHANDDEYEIEGDFVFPMNPPPPGTFKSRSKEEIARNLEWKKNFDKDVDEMIKNYHERMAKAKEEYRIKCNTPLSLIPFDMRDY